LVVGEGNGVVRTLFFGTAAAGALPEAVLERFAMLDERHL
jgi:hypothetical protein